MSLFEPNLYALLIRYFDIIHRVNIGPMDLDLINEIWILIEKDKFVHEINYFFMFLLASKNLSIKSLLSLIFFFIY